MDLFETMRASYLTEGLSDNDVRSLLSVAEFVEHEDLQEIVRAKDTSYDLFVLVEGSAEVATENGDLISRLKPGAIIGEFAFFENGQRSATVISHGKSTLFHLDGEKLNAHLDANPQIGMVIYRNLGRTLCTRLRSANVQIERLVSSI